MNIITKLRDIFINESQKSLMLLEDLANMESYIAESYHSRSVIELLQNADDAQAHRFYITSEEDYIIVANDGRYFNEKDIISICRSGSSTKKRDGKSIGYRGIGFKSVINLAERVHIVSGEFNITFSKRLTADVLSTTSQVPLIRIPHPYTPISDHSLLINKLKNEKYNTIFIFERINIHNLKEDIDSLDSSILLFLNNITEFKIEIGQKKVIKADRKNIKDNEIISISNEKGKENWIVSKDNKHNAVAFLLNENNKIIELDSQRAVIHSFMPTKDQIGVNIKINGDFSTDPSRTRVVYDDFTKVSLDACSNILINILKENLNIDNKNYYGVFEILSRYSKNIQSRFTSNIKIGDRFFDIFEDKLNTNNWFRGGYTKNLRVNPKWLNSKDFEKICTILNLIPISKELERDYVGIIRFCEKFNIKTLDLEDALSAIKVINISSKGSIEIMSEFINKYRFNCNEHVLNEIRNSKIFYLKSGVFSSNEIEKDTEILFNENFYYNLVNIITDKSDLIWIINKIFGDKANQVITTNKMHTKNNLYNNEKSKLKNLLEEEIVSYKSKSSLPSVNKWRSVEKNLTSFLELEDNVEQAIDVSKSNLGYDIEVHYKDKSIHYIEVKSVERLGTTISITNNEYSTANELEEEYLLAIVHQTDNEMNVCYIKNPIKTLNLIKRITRWEWICEDYDIKYKSYIF